MFCRSQTELIKLQKLSNFIIYIHVIILAMTRPGYDTCPAQDIKQHLLSMIPELKDLSYEERLKESGLAKLETRRLRGDQT